MSPSVPSSARAVARTLASTTSTIPSDGPGRRFEREGSAGAAAGTREHFVDGWTTRLRDQPRAEVFLKRLVGIGSAPLEDGVRVLGHILDLHAGHGATLAPMALMCKFRACRPSRRYSTVTLLARLRGWSTSVPR